MCIFIVNVNTNLRKITFNYNILRVSAVYKHQQEDFTIYMEKNTEVEITHLQLI
jgi:hypothetical protein